MSLPSEVTTTNLDSDGDDPEQSLLVDAKATADTLNLLIQHLALSLITSTPLKVGDGLEASGGFLRPKLDGTTLARAAAGLKLADDAVDLTHLKHQTAGMILFFGGSGVPALLAKKNDGDILSLVGGLPDWVAPPAGGYEFVSSSPWTSGNTLSFALGGDANKIHEFEITDLRPGSADAALSCDASDDDEVSYEDGIVQYAVGGPNVADAATNGVDDVPLTGGIAVDSDNNDVNQASGKIFMRRALDAGAFTHMSWGLQWGLANANWYGVVGSAILKHSAALTHLRFGWAGGVTGGAGTITQSTIDYPRS